MYVTGECCGPPVPAPGKAAVELLVDNPPEPTRAGLFAKASDELTLTGTVLYPDGAKFNGRPGEVAEAPLL